MSKRKLPILAKNKTYNLRTLQSVYRHLNKSDLALERQTEAASKRNKPNRQHVCLLSDKDKSWDQVKQDVSEFGKLI